MDKAGIQELAQKILDKAQLVQDYSCEVDGYEEAEGKHQFRKMKNIYLRDPELMLVETLSSNGNYKSRAQPGSKILLKRGKVHVKMTGLLSLLPIVISPDDPKAVDKRGNKISETAMVALMEATGQKLKDGVATYDGVEEKNSVSCHKITYPIKKKKPGHQTVYLAESNLDPVYYAEFEEGVEKPMGYWSVLNLKINSGLDKKHFQV